MITTKLTANKTRRKKFTNTWDICINKEKKTE